jgi:hypothetical protein
MHHPGRYIPVDLRCMVVLIVIRWTSVSVAQRRIAPPHAAFPGDRASVRAGVDPHERQLDVAYRLMLSRPGDEGAPPALTSSSRRAMHPSDASVISTTIRAGGPRCGQAPSFGPRVATLAHGHALLNLAPTQAIEIFCPTNQIRPTALIVACGRLGWTQAFDRAYERALQQLATLKHRQLWEETHGKLAASQRQRWIFEEVHQCGAHQPRIGCEGKAGGLHHLVRAFRHTSSWTHRAPIQHG